MIIFTYYVVDQSQCWVNGIIDQASLEHLSGPEEAWAGADKHANVLLCRIVTQSQSRVILWSQG